MKNIAIIFISIFGFTNCNNSPTEYKSFEMTPQGDTINVTDMNGKKQGVWVNTKRQETIVSSDTIYYKDGTEVKKTAQ